MSRWSRLEARKAPSRFEDIFFNSYLLLCPQGSQTFRFSSKDEKWNSLAKNERTGLLEQTWILAWQHQRNWHFLSKSGMATTLVSYSKFLKLHYFWPTIRTEIFSIFCINLHESRVLILWLEIMLFALLIRFFISFGRAHHLLNPFTAVGAHRVLIDFTLSNARRFRRFYSSMGNPLAAKGLMRVSVLFHTVKCKTAWFSYLAVSMAEPFPYGPIHGQLQLVCRCVIVMHVETLCGNCTNGVWGAQPHL